MALRLHNDFIGLHNDLIGHHNDLIGHHGRVLLARGEHEKKSVDIQWLVKGNSQVKAVKIGLNVQ